MLLGCNIRSVSYYPLCPKALYTINFQILANINFNMNFPSKVEFIEIQSRIFKKFIHIFSKNWFQFQASRNQIVQALWLVYSPISPCASWFGTTSSSFNTSKNCCLTHQITGSNNHRILRIALLNWDRRNSFLSPNLDRYFITNLWKDYQNKYITDG